jgi:hypothetical protein
MAGYRASPDSRTIPIVPAQSPPVPAKWDSLRDGLLECRMLPLAPSLHHSMPVETQNSFCSGSDILTQRVPPKLCTPSSIR